jgi:hypothetical protein
MMKDCIIGPFFFHKATVASHLYLHLLEHCRVPQMPCAAWFHQDGAPPHFGKIVCQILNERLVKKWIGTGGFLA